MAPRVLNLCQFHFADQDIRVVGSEVDGGTSIGGISDTVATDGGGYWQGDWSNSDFGGRSDDERAETLAWRAMNAGLSGGRVAVVRFNDRWHQPVGDRLRPQLGSSDSFYGSSGAAASVLAIVNGQAGGLNATILDIAITSEKPLIGGERFTYVHPTWRERCAEIGSVEPIPNGYRVSFIPPIRGGISVGDALDFDDPRCAMKRISAPSNALNMGVWSSAELTMVEDMRDPDL